MWHLNMYYRWAIHLKLVLYMLIFSSVATLFPVQQIQYSQRGTFINPLTPVDRIIHARSNTAAEHPFTLVVMILAYRDDRTRGFAVVARDGSSRSTVFHRLHCTCKLYKIRDHRVRPSGSAVFVHRVARCSLPWAIEHR